MQANTAYFNSPKFDLIELTALLTLWFYFMFKGLMTTLYSIADWLEGQRTIQLGDLHEPNRVYPSPNVDDTATCDPVITINPDPVTTATIDPDPQPMTTFDPAPVTTVNPDPDDNATVTYKDLQALLRDYRNNRGEIQCKLNAKRETLEREAQRLGLIA